jgi:tRNA 5-methylaminomethyl-2-thiouridine biosynthesis bifunctional protein
MAEVVAWDDDGTPRSPRFGDVYRPAHGGLAQARRIFLEGCGLPAAWRGQPHWRVLETGFGLGLNFLATWRAWQDDPARPRMLHYASVEAWPVAAADVLRGAAAHPELEPLAQALAAQWRGLTPGFHRIAFDDGRVLLTVCIGPVEAMLREHAFRADTVFLDGFDPARNPDMWALGTLKAVTRLCRRGTALASWTAAGHVRRDLQSCGFAVEKVEGLPPKRESLRASYAPGWEVKNLPATAHPGPAASALVVGAGLAGGAIAASLARRGWTVDVVDAAPSPATGASALPAGLLAPHQSPDDNLLSRLSRSGVRITLQEAARRLAPADWAPTGVLEHRGSDARPLPPLGDALDPWSREASDEQRVLGQQAGAAWWHEWAGWIRPAALVERWLAEPGVRFRGGRAVAALTRSGGDWVACDAHGGELARAPVVVLAAALGTAALARGRIRTHPVRGQVAWGLGTVPVPRFPLNGNGHFIPGVPTPEGPAWFSGSSYGRGDAATDVRDQDHAANLARLQDLLPATAAALAPAFAAGTIRAWTGVRCASPDRRPLVGELEPGLWVCTALGSRGLTFAPLCAELLAARLNGEPWPLARRLAETLDAARATRS